MTRWPAKHGSSDLARQPPHLDGACNASRSEAEIQYQPYGRNVHAVRVAEWIKSGLRANSAIDGAGEPNQAHTARIRIPFAKPLKMYDS